MKRIIKHGTIMREREEKVSGIVREYIYGYEAKGDDFYLILGGRDILRKLHTQWDAYLMRPYKDSRCRILDIDGVPHTVLRVNEKYVGHLYRQETLHTAYCVLLQYLTDDDMRLCFPDLWLVENNQRAREENRREYNECHGKFAKATSDHKHIAGITTRHNVRSCARWAI